jgi:putative ABC transport system substrate-binding protein
VKRRAFLSGMVAMLITPLDGEAQPTRAVYRIGVLETVPATSNTANFDAFLRGLRELGYVEGQNLVIDYRSADGHSERFPNLAADLVRLKVDLILTRGTPAALAAKDATRTIPVVMASSGDPLVSGIVASLANPGGNVTGLSADATDIEGKRLELLKQMVPGLKRIAGVFNTGNPVALPQWRETQKAAGSLGVQAYLLDVRKSDDLPRAFDSAVKQRAQALVVGLDTVLEANRQSIVDLAASRRLPAIYQSRGFVDAGGLIAYAVSFPHNYFRAATYVDKIFRGAKPASLPIEQPVKFELVINRKTANELGLVISPPLLARADEVIE